VAVQAPSTKAVSNKAMIMKFLFRILPSFKKNVT